MVLYEILSGNNTWSKLVTALKDEISSKSISYALYDSKHGLKSMHLVNTIDRKLKIILSRDALILVLGLLLKHPEKGQIYAENLSGLLRWVHCSVFGEGNLTDPDALNGEQSIEWPNVMWRSRRTMSLEFAVSYFIHVLQLSSDLNYSEGRGYAVAAFSLAFSSEFGIIDYSKYIQREHPERIKECYHYLLEVPTERGSLSVDALAQFNSEFEIEWKRRFETSAYIEMRTLQLKIRTLLYSRKQRALEFSTKIPLKPVKVEI